MARKKKTGAGAGAPAAPSAPSKTALLIDLLSRTTGATLDEMVASTGWQAHSVRGALSGALRKKGHAVSSEKVDGVRRYRIEAAQ